MRILVLVLLAIVLLAGCGGDDKDDKYYQMGVILKEGPGLSEKEQIAQGDTVYFSSVKEAHEILKERGGGILYLRPVMVVEKGPAGR